ncbi:MAG: helix-turn-helix transcriptional regulator [Xanthobacteraceae bacterium]|nr:helix-turn-helix transcriptional regulator [Xanthobacteraceae bacterium]
MQVVTAGLTGRQLAAARVLAGLRQSDIAAAAGCSLPTIKRLETAPRPKLSESFAAVVRVLEAAGVEFIERGVRLR